MPEGVRPEGSGSIPLPPGRIGPPRGKRQGKRTSQIVKKTAGKPKNEALTTRVEKEHCPYRRTEGKKAGLESRVGTPRGFLP